MLITNGTIVTPGVRRRTINRQVTLGPVALRFVTVTVLAAAAFVALIQTTSSSTKAYIKADYDEKVSAGQQEVQELQDEGIRLKAISTLYADVQAEVTPSPKPALEESKKINHLPSSNEAITQLPAAE